MDERALLRGIIMPYSEETTVEEKDKRGVTINKYIKGRYLGKVHQPSLREVSLSAMSLHIPLLVANLQRRSSKRVL
jgi:phage-related protein